MKSKKVPILHTPQEVIDHFNLPPQIKELPNLNLDTALNGYILSIFIPYDS
jgi:hypothetical protein